jgi:UDP-N-acetylmuramoyl-tripeptide--D-alanyl-D-alanine ligase
VVELGARHVGDIAALCEVARPDIGVLTTVAVAHTGEFGSLEAVARTKGELFDALPPDGCAVLNADVPEVVAQAYRSRSQVLTFGDTGEVRARDIVLDDDLRASFRLESPWGRTEVRLSVHGAHMVPNALAAAAVGLVLDMPLADVAAGLAEGVASPWRMELGTAPSGLRVLNDAYNANPASTAAALESLAALPVVGRRVAVLGLMAELGDRAADEHLAIAQRVADLGLELVAVGTDLYGVESLADLDAAHGALDLAADDAVLVKGSRVAGLEVLAELLLEG